MYKESAEAYIKRILGDIAELEDRITAALNLPKGRSYNLKRAGTLLAEMVKNKEAALALTFTVKEGLITVDNYRAKVSKRSRIYSRINERIRNDKKK